MAKPRPTSLPSDPAEWESRAKDYGLTNIGSGLRDVSEMDSASKVEFKDWLQLRILWKVVKEKLPDHETLFGKDFGGDGVSDLEKQSRALLKSLPWSNALTKDSNEPCEWHALATWKDSVVSLVRRAQTLQTNDAGKKTLHDMPSGEDLFKLRIEPAKRPQRSTNQQPKYTYSSSEEELAGLSQGEKGKAQQQSPASTLGGSTGARSFDGRISSLIHSRPPAEDEVNYSLLILLGGLCLHDPVISKSLRWSAVRKEFTVSKPKDGGANPDIIAARVDGCLQALKTGELDEECPTLAIIEVKARRRDGTNSRVIQMQEGAEMAAWISSQPNYGLLPTRVDDSGTYRRVIISQDFDNIYITVASYDRGYLDFITAQNTSRSLRKVSPDSPTALSRAANEAAVGDASDTESSDAPSERSSTSPNPQGWTTRLPIHRTRPQTPSREPARASPPLAPAKKTVPVDDSDEEEDKQEKATPSFLTMRQYEPFKITNAKHMERLMVLLLSLGRALYREHNPLGGRK